MMTAFEEKDRPGVKNGELFKLPQYIELLTGKTFNDPSSSNLQNALGQSFANALIPGLSLTPDKVYSRET